VSRGIIDGVKAWFSAPGKDALYTQTTLENIGAAASEATLNSFKTAANADATDIKNLIALAAGDANADALTIQNKQDTGNVSLASIDGKVSTAAKQDTLNTTLVETNLRLGPASETQATNDTATSGLNGLIKRLLRLSSGASTATNTVLTPAGNTSTQVLAANSNRKWVRFNNTSGATFFINLGSAAVLNRGIPLKNNGDLVIGKNDLYLGAIFCIVGSNGRTLDISEGE